MSCSKRPDSDAVCYTKPLDSLKRWNDHFFLVDSFACPASFSWHTDKNVSRDPFPKSTKFRADDYAVLVAYPAPFRKFPEPFLRLVRMSHNYTLYEDTYPIFLHDGGTAMDLLAFIHVADPTKVKIRERERAEEEARLVDSIVGRVVSLLPVAPDRADSELEASVEKLFDESGGADQGDSAVGGDQETEAEIVSSVRFVDEENVAAKKPKRPRKKRQAATDSSGSFHPPKKLRSDHGTSSRAVSAGKSLTVLRQLLASSILNVESGVEAVATLPFVASSISATPEPESGVPADSLNKISTPSVHLKVPPVMTEAVITTHVASIPSAPAPESNTKVLTPVHASMFHDSNSTGMVRPDATGSSHRPGKELSMGSREVDSESLYEVFVLRWSIPNDSLLDDLDASREFIDHLALLVLFAQIRDMDYEELFTEFSVGTTRQACLSAKVRMRTEYCLNERSRLESVCEKQTGLLKSRDEEVKNLKTQLFSKEAEAAKVVRLRTQVSAFEFAEKVHTSELDTLKRKNVVLEDEKNSLKEKVVELQSLVSVKDRELKDVDAIVTSLKSQNDRLANQVRALEITCSGLREQLSGYENLTKRLEEFHNAEMKVVNKRVEKLDADLLEMACHLEEKFYPHLLTTISGRRWLLTHGLKLVLIKCLNSSEYLTALGAAISRSIEKGMHDGLAAGIDHGRARRNLLYDVDFPLLAELKSHKDASIEDVMNLLCLESPLADAPGMDSLQPDVEQLRVPIHRSEDQVVLGLTGAASTSASIPTATSITMALSTTFASASSIPPIFVDDYEIIHTDGQENS
ncbi:hypothetical protein Tco_0615030 [Tanacetum coccineum]